jgi:hypothetical protein
MLRNDSTTLAKDLPPVVNDDRPELETYGKLCNDRPNSADKEGMKNAMNQIDKEVND